MVAILGVSWYDDPIGSTANRRLVEGSAVEALRMYCRCMSQVSGDPSISLVWTVVLIRNPRRRDEVSVMRSEPSILPICKSIRVLWEEFELVIFVLERRYV